MKPFAVGLLLGVLISPLPAAASDLLLVPSGCKLSADAMVTVHTVLCDSRIECTERVVKLVCQGESN